MKNARRIAWLAPLLFSACGAPMPDDGTVEEYGTVRRGVDYSWARPSPGSLKAAGFTFAARYLSYDNSGKNLSRAEANSLIAAGLDVVSNWEQSGTDALDGFSRGVSDARSAESEALADGMPGTRPIYFSVDFDAQPSQQGVVNAYFDGVASVIGRSRTGAYGGFYLMKRLFDDGKISWGWQTYAWSYGQWEPRAQLRQTQNGIWGGSLDEDEAVAADFGQWGHAPPPPPPPTCKGGSAPPVYPAPPGCGEMRASEGLKAGESVRSCDGRFDFVFQGDGNVVLYSEGVALWASHTVGKGGYSLPMQGDGNLVLYEKNGCPLWATGTDRHAGARLAVQDDGNAVIYSGSQALWSTQTGGFPPSPTGCGSIPAGHGLAAGESVRSCDGRFVLVMQGDGNLVLYQGSRALWSSRTNGTASRIAEFQTDGNLVVYELGHTPTWAAGTWGHPGSTFAVQNDGNLVVYHGSTPLWSSRTGGH